MFKLLTKAFQSEAPVDRTYLAVAHIKKNLEKAKKSGPNAGLRYLNVAVMGMEHMFSKQALQKKPLGREASEEYLKAATYMLDNKDFILANSNAEEIGRFSAAVRGASDMLHRDGYDKGSLLDKDVTGSNRYQTLKPLMSQLRFALSQPVSAIAANVAAPARTPAPVAPAAQP
jgi:hypothetical protein